MRDSLKALQTELDELKILAAQPLIHNLHSREKRPRLRDAEFKVFSQFGDDGIIQYLIHRVQVVPESFVEFGVENYRESNTRFLLLNNNWRGLVLDADEGSIRYIQQDDIYWRHTLTARSAFIDRDNVNDLIREAGFTGEIGLLSIDIDGNDYWVWEKLNIVDPVIVIIEYNSVFGPDLAIAVPYDPGFVRYRAHYSGQFTGASLKALSLLAARKGYLLVGCNSAGNNAYFVRRDKVGELPVFPAEHAFVDARFRDSRDKDGNLTLLTGMERFQEISAMDVYDFEQNRVVPLRSLCRLNPPNER